MMKKLNSLFLSMLVLLSCLSTSVSAFAKDNNTYSKEVEISKADKNYSPDEEIRVDGKTYKFVDYDIVDEKPATFTVKKEKLKSKDYTAEQTAVNPDDKSSKGKLISTAFEEETESNRKTIVTKKLKYSAVQTDYSFPESYQTEYADKETDRKITASLKLTSVNKSNPYWIDTSAMEGTVTGYDALVYTLANSNVQIPKNIEKPNYKGYENAILKSLNLSSKNYRITGAALRPITMQTIFFVETAHIQCSLRYVMLKPFMKVRLTCLIKLHILRFQPMRMKRQAEWFYHLIMNRLKITPKQL